ncbi:MAG: FAD-binding oxidoreductase, partial [Rhodocyclaceae bacterium]|nr:FAD-binding oxidoreductase [Rhodocyclaceae bacterium]
MADAFVEGLAELLGRANVLDDAVDMAPYLTDWRGRFTGRARAVLRPGSAPELSELVARCHAAGVPMVPQGGNTGLCGGATPRAGGDEVVISLGRLNRIRESDAANNTLVVEAGCTLAAVQEAAANIDRLFPLSLASEGSCQIGGNLSTNAGGVHVLRYGNTRDLVLGIEAVLPDGRLWNGLRGLRKDNTGY